MNPKLKSIRAAMRMALSQGFDPYNSHETQAKVMERRWKMEAGRIAKERSEAAANRWLKEALEMDGHSPWKQAG